MLLQLCCPACNRELGDFLPVRKRPLVCSCGFELAWSHDCWDACVDKSYPRDFARQWVLWEAGRLGDRRLVYGTEPRRIFESLLRFTSLTESDLRSMRILEVGFGHGRLLREIQRYSDTAFGIDLVRPLKSAHLRPGSAIFGNLFRIPFKPRQFDLVISRGVVQTTPDPRAAFGCLAEQVAEGGTLCLAGLYEVGYKGSLVFRKLLPMSWKYPERLRLGFSSILAWGRALLELIRDRTFRVSELKRHYAHYKLDIFDVISPRWSSKHSATEVREWFASCGLEVRNPFPGVFVGVRRSHIADQAGAA